MSAGTVDRDTVARLRWRCRRGMRELDVLLLGFLEREFAGAPADERQAFAQLLELPDPELMDLLLGRAEAGEPAAARLVERLRAGQRGGAPCP